MFRAKAKAVHLDGAHNPRGPAAKPIEAVAITRGERGIFPNK